MPAPARILIVDDDEEIAALLSQFLSDYGYAIQAVHDGVAMHQALSRQSFDLVVLDIMLPGKDGMTLLGELQNSSKLPVIMLSARSSAFDRVVGLESGAEDYLGKPFEPRELVARIQSVLRRRGRAAPSPEPSVSGDTVVFDGWELHRRDHCLFTPDGLILPLSNAEFRILCTLLDTPRRPFRREQLLESALRHQDEVNQRSVDLLVSRLRNKLARTPVGVDMIKTVRGVGYMLNVQSVQGRIAWRH